ncbi:hypothetical protein [Cellulosimicrobium marinum]|uniref:hypothetical protein n=1 Tax=Cellulosimicrobium marinum TaxID=1638992 RepID=UPI001E535A7D|nr:hypothetical protein [Cellulosimicrobium marinum]MCB7135352.1 hypothetical protein [Cellulosimicrobium marinum]
MATRDLIKRKFGTLWVIGRADARNRHAHWKCWCFTCKRTVIVASQNLLSGNTKTCGDRSVHPRTAAPSYPGVHRAVAKRWGSSSEWFCECGSQAQTWSYKGNDPDELLTPGGYRFTASTDFRFWEPLCIACHHAKDAQRRAAR